MLRSAFPRKPSVLASTLRRTARASRRHSDLLRSLDVPEGAAARYKLDSQSLAPRHHSSSVTWSNRSPSSPRGLYKAAVVVDRLFSDAASPSCTTPSTHRNRGADFAFYLPIVMATTQCSTWLWNGALFANQEAGHTAAVAAARSAEGC